LLREKLLGGINYRYCHFLLQAESEEMDKEIEEAIKEAIRRRDREEFAHLMACGTLIAVPLLLLGFLITRYAS
jgi:hypothetical protein